MGQMDNLAETTAVDVRIEDGKSQGEQGEEAKENSCDKSHGNPPDATDQRRSQQGLEQGDSHRKRLGHRQKKVQMYQSEIFLQHKSGPDGVEDFEYSCKKENEADNGCAQPLQFAESPALYHNQ